jgi:hypothetical protein
MLLLWFISLDCRQGFHQILIRLLDQEKTAFYTPNGDKECLTVMPFGPMNGPATYTAMMFELREEWMSLFLKCHPEHAKFVADSRTIIDDILNWSTDPDALLDLFECICIVFLKYRVSFRLDKCEFFKDLSSISVMISRLLGIAQPKASMTSFKTGPGRQRPKASFPLSVSAVFTSDMCPGSKWVSRRCARW